MYWKLFLENTSLPRKIKQSCKDFHNPWWRHGMESLCTSPALCVGNPPISVRFSSYRVSNAEPWCFTCFQSERIQQPSCKWYETPLHDNYVIKLKIFRLTIPWGHLSPVNSPHKGKWHGALMFSLICARTNSWANHRDAGDLRRHHAHIVVSVIGRRISHSVMT